MKITTLGNEFELVTCVIFIIYEFLPLRPLKKKTVV